MKNVAMLEKLEKATVETLATCENLQVALVKSRKATCKCGNIILGGTVHYGTVTPKTYHHTCTKCFSTMWETTDCKGNNNNVMSDPQNYLAVTTKEHAIVVIAKKEYAVGMIEYGFNVKPYSPTHRLYTLDGQLNRHCSGHIIKPMLDNGFKVFVNGTEVTDFDTFDSITRK